jgi:hypothetical protein
MIDDCGDPKIIDFGSCCSNFNMDFVEAAFDSTQRERNNVS